MAGRFVATMVAKLPPGWQRELRRLHFLRTIQNRRFLTDEPEYELLGDLIGPGDWAIDVGANVGHYTARMSELVGRNGRVIAFEPVADTFAILAWNLRALGQERDNVTLINAAVSDTGRLVGMCIPTYESGLRNFYRAEICDRALPGRSESLAVTLDQFAFGHRIGLVKIDVEGHEAAVLAGMHELLRRDFPSLILETESDLIREELGCMGYSVVRLPGSANLLCRPPT